jgi:hypothetical protein
MSPTQVEDYVMTAQTALAAASNEDVEIRSSESVSGKGSSHGRKRVAASDHDDESDNNVVEEDVENYRGAGNAVRGGRGNSSSNGGDDDDDASIKEEDSEAEGQDSWDDEDDEEEEQEDDENEHRKKPSAKRQKTASGKTSSKQAIVKKKTTSSSGAKASGILPLIVQLRQHCDMVYPSDHEYHVIGTNSAGQPLLQLPEKPQSLDDEVDRMLQASVKFRVSQCA